jgi:bifunctional DNA-binding transcriptional regulator/antitoxin component of YhaV-PrlF toxin-antitoxin module
MKFIRRTDQRNRITIPKKIIQALGMGSEAAYEISFLGDKIVLTPHRITCHTCGKTITSDYRTVFLCDRCFGGIER